MKTKIILETGCNHQGSVDIAREMIYLAAKLGVWGVKFQKRDIESFPESLKKKKRDPLTSFGDTYYSHRRALEFNVNELKYLKDFTESNGLTFLCSAFDKQSIIDLVSIDCEYIKLPSQLYTRRDLQKQLLMLKESNNFKIIVSTGMHVEQEIMCNPWISKADIIMHCISVYPFELPCNYQLGFFNRLQLIRRGKPCGYSSHGLCGDEIDYVVLCGAEYVERHFTLDKHLKGSDHGTVSSDFDEMKAIIHNIRMAESMLGEQRTLSPAEKKVKQIYRG